MTLEDVLTTWSQPPGTTEQEQSKNAESAVRKALAASTALRNKSVDVFTHGSYRNRVTIRGDSDVDLGVVCPATFFYDLPEGGSPGRYGIVPATYPFSQFKNDVYAALIAYFGSTSVRRGDKAFDIQANSYRLDADVAPFLNIDGTRTQAITRESNCEPIQAGELSTGLSNIMRMAFRKTKEPLELSRESFASSSVQRCAWKKKPRSRGNLFPGFSSRLSLTMCRIVFFSEQHGAGLRVKCSYSCSMRHPTTSAAPNGPR